MRFGLLDQRKCNAITLVLTDPNPPPVQTYLENELVKIHLKTIERNPQAGESVHRRLMRAVLAWLFPPNEGYEVIQEEDRGGRPNLVVFKISCRPGGSAYTYDFCIVESKAKGAPWGSTEDQCANACFETENEVKKVYAMVHIGTGIGFYKYEDGDFTNDKLVHVVSRIGCAYRGEISQAKLALTRQSKTSRREAILLAKIDEILVEIK
ncbi:hypothetical protein IL306_014384 [Fusarium sp. DS 682]|nr:hypothetical protein IL306_014384 [Fusarium sp. DS 682]